MKGIVISIEKDVVGHVARAIGPDGEVVASAFGFGARDARRKLKIALGEEQTPTTVLKRAQNSNKIHSPAGVIFAAKRNIEFKKARRVGIRTRHKKLV